jgi:hypothetical protein
LVSKVDLRTHVRAAMLRARSRWVKGLPTTADDQRKSEAVARIQPSQPATVP